MCGAQTSSLDGCIEVRRLSFSNHFNFFDNGVFDASHLEQILKFSLILVPLEAPFTFTVLHSQLQTFLFIF
jgi:hypothetical protein